MSLPSMETSPTSKLSFRFAEKTTSFRSAETSNDSMARKDGVRSFSPRTSFAPPAVVTTRTSARSGVRQWTSAQTCVGSIAFAGVTDQEGGMGREEDTQLATVIAPTSTTTDRITWIVPTGEDARVQATLPPLRGSTARTGSEGSRPGLMPLGAFGAHDREEVVSRRTQHLQLALLRFGANHRLTSTLSRIS